MEDLDTLRDRALKLLEDERRAMHTGDMATRLGVPTHKVHGAMHVPLMRGRVWFSSSEGYSLAPLDRRTAGDDGSQQRIA